MLIYGKQEAKITDIPTFEIDMGPSKFRKFAPWGNIAIVTSPYIDNCDPCIIMLKYTKTRYYAKVLESCESDYPSIIIDGESLGESIDAVRKLWNKLPLTKHMIKTEDGGMLLTDEDIVQTYYSIRPVFYQATDSENYFSDVLDAVRTIFDLLRERKKANKLYEFWCGEDISLADLCMWALYLKMIKAEPHLVPLVMDAYTDLQPYF